MPVTADNIRLALWRCKQDRAFLRGELLRRIADQPQDVQDDLEAEVRTVMHAIQFPAHYDRREPEVIEIFMSKT